MIPASFKKALTLSFDDGVTQDIRFIEMLNKYGLKATFNINSELLGRDGALVRMGKHVSHVKVQPSDVASIYAGHEVAVHTLTHPNLCTLDEEEIVRQVECDRMNLSKLCGYEVVGMAYPCGGVNNDERVADVIRRRTGVKYSRTITSTDNFDVQDNLYRFNPSVYILDFDRMEELAREFVCATPDKTQIFYIWGHTYEFDVLDAWDRFEELCKFLSGRSDIFYGTNKEILLP